MSVDPVTRTRPEDVDPAEARRRHRRAMVSSCLGSIIEFDDFLLYASASALVFGSVFFSTLSPLAGTLASLGTFAAGYVARLRPGPARDGRPRPGRHDERANRRLSGPRRIQSARCGEFSVTT